MDILVARTPGELSEAFAQLCIASHLGCDTETSGFTARDARLFSLQLSDGDLGVLVPISEGVSPGRLSDLLSNPTIVKVFHNAKFDLQFLDAAGMSVDNVFDTMIAERVLTRGANQSSSLSETLYRHFAVDLDKSQRAKFSRRWDGIWTDELVEYALSDVVHLPRLMREQEEWLQRLGLSVEFALQMRRALQSTPPA